MRNLLSILVIVGGIVYYIQWARKGSVEQSEERKLYLRHSFRLALIATPVYLVTFIAVLVWAYNTGWSGSWAAMAMLAQSVVVIGGVIWVWYKFFNKYHDRDKLFPRQ